MIHWGLYIHDKMLRDLTRYSLWPCCQNITTPITIDLPQTDRALKFVVLHLRQRDYFSAHSLWATKRQGVDKKQSEQKNWGKVLTRYMLSKIVLVLAPDNLVRIFLKVIPNQLS